MIAAIVLAAGQSRRMGTQKLLLPVRGQAMIANVVDELLRSPLDQVYVVVGRDGQQITEALVGRDVRTVFNAVPEQEMLSSVRCGLAAVPEQAEAVIVALGDQPQLSADVVARQIQAFRQTGRGIVVPTYQGKRGHPLLFSLHYRDEILSQYDGCGLRGLLEAHPQDVLELEVTTAAVLEDIDRPQDYQRVVS